MHKKIKIIKFKLKGEKVIFNWKFCNSFDAKSNSEFFYTFLFRRRYRKTLSR
jgi:hypothetical protein